MKKRRIRDLSWRVTEEMIANFPELPAEERAEAAEIYCAYPESLPGFMVI